MLRSLKVKNYALIADAELLFSSGMNIITGETGAGKSILLGALGLALGKRADTSSLSNKEAKCVIEATFSVKDYGLESFYTAYDLDYDEQTILRREISTSGKSRSFINDSPVNLTMLNDLGSRLIEIHSQHDNLQLFKQDFQYYSLDILAGCLDEQQAYLLVLQQWKQDIKSLQKLQDQEVELAKEADFNQFLFDELASANLESVDEKSLVKEQVLLENAEELIRTFNTADQLLGGTDYAIITQLQELKNLLKSQRTALTENLAERVNAVLIETQDIAGEVDKLADTIEVNPERLNEVNDTLALVFSLKAKHRVADVAELVNLRYELENKLGITQNLAGKIAKLQSHIDHQQRDLVAKAKVLSKKRETRAPQIEENINELLYQLGMHHSRIKFDLQEGKELNSFGCNELVVKLSSDKGNTFSELKKSASGGELARINLSLKSILADFVKMPCSVYDEIDTGVSGEIARKVGGMMNQMSDSQQVIVITHLPQIASLGENHLFVYKQDVNQTVETRVRTLSAEERISEVAKMISGDSLTEHALEQSRELLKG